MTKNNVHHLTLAFVDMIDREDYVLPEHFYANSSLKILELTNCEVAPVGIVSWKSLTRLCLRGMRLSDDVMEGILSGCPSLEVLELIDYCGFNCLKVSSPSLRELVLSSFEDPCDEEGDPFEEDDEEAYLAISAPNLRTLTISYCFYTWNVILEDVRSLVSADLSFYLESWTLTK